MVAYEAFRHSSALREGPPTFGVPTILQAFQTTPTRLRCSLQWAAGGQPLEAGGPIDAAVGTVYNPSEELNSMRAV